ncbi:hypothetical protein CEUSTIGMA_g8978.t1 [Chlamydomonas eustigma]|uniref:Guanylate cyclase domain-containing protein n=1 Tax=Chlamydomonas eustigma TaxID=1157962 RepID=A0A250XFI9_9CHLO|nr:hypothetical protein CEUSTIGMA_g8978.t1 [Chlamydomonas eustigma]|eukprot:GAX81550.1 hypothetical protein CEUSTIGMA_g8978.t1 [Chlamydomonas eustigma]
MKLFARCFGRNDGYTGNTKQRSDEKHNSKKIARNVSHPPDVSSSLHQHQENEATAFDNLALLELPLFDGQTDACYFVLKLLDPSSGATSDQRRLSRHLLILRMDSAGRAHLSPCPNVDPLTEDGSCSTYLDATYVNNSLNGSDSSNLQSIKKLCADANNDSHFGMVLLCAVLAVQAGRPYGQECTIRCTGGNSEAALCDPLVEGDCAHVQACMWSAGMRDHDPNPMPAVIVQYQKKDTVNTLFSNTLVRKVQANVNLMDHVPAAVTLCALDGKVVYQNKFSRDYFGDVLGQSAFAGVDITHTSTLSTPTTSLAQLFPPLPLQLQALASVNSLLSHLLSFEAPSLIPELLHTVSSPGGPAWKCIVRVPRAVTSPLLLAKVEKMEPFSAKQDLEEEDVGAGHHTSTSLITMEEISPGVSQGETSPVPPPEEALLDSDEDDELSALGIHADIISTPLMRTLPLHTGISGSGLFGPQALGASKITSGMAPSSQRRRLSFEGHEEVEVKKAVNDVLLRKSLRKVSVSGASTSQTGKRNSLLSKFQRTMQLMESVDLAGGPKTSSIKISSKKSPLNAASSKSEHSMMTEIPSTHPSDFSFALGELKQTNEDSAVKRDANKPLPASSGWFQASKKMVSGDTLSTTLQPLLSGSTSGVSRDLGARSPPNRAATRNSYDEGILLLTANLVESSGTSRVGDTFQHSASIPERRRTSIEELSIRAHKDGTGPPSRSVPECDNSMLDLSRTILHDSSSFSAEGLAQSNATESPQPTSGVADQSQRTEQGLDVECWHEVIAQLIRDEAHGHGGSPLLLLVQTDVSERIHMETLLGNMSEGQLSLLSSIFPRHVVEFLSANDLSQLSAHFGSLARSHNHVTILFLDIVGFTVMSNSVKPPDILLFLNQLFTMFDVLADKHNVQKVDTAGDCYIASAGITGSDADGSFFQTQTDNGDEVADCAIRVIEFAKDMLRCSKEVTMPHNGQPVSVRIGIHTGPCVSGLVGTKVPKFSVFGDTINTASRMESTCEPGCIQVSASTHEILIHGGCNAEEWEALGQVQIKGKGMMETFLWRPPKDQASILPMPSEAFQVLKALRPSNNGTISFVLEGAAKERPSDSRTNITSEERNSASTPQTTHQSLALLNPGLRLMIESLQNHRIVKRHDMVSNFAASSTALGGGLSLTKINQLPHGAFERSSTSLAPESYSSVFKSMDLNGNNTDKFHSSSHLLTSLEHQARMRPLLSMPEEESLE